uniref:Uncharacterized protein n=1 Tax=Anguilla anguilla TaxID=7936 RepID=A0A0E9TB91_ANGAN
MIAQEHIFHCNHLNDDTVCI